MRFNTRHFLLEEIGTPQDVLDLFAKFEENVPTLPAVTKWFQRGNIPGAWFPVLLGLLERERGVPVPLEHYSIEGE